MNISLRNIAFPTFTVKRQSVTNTCLRIAGSFSLLAVAVWRQIKRSLQHD